MGNWKYRLRPLDQFAKDSLYLLENVHSLPASVHHPCKKRYCGCFSLEEGLILGSGEPAGRDRTTNRRRVGLGAFKMGLKDGYAGL
jgi:hypothetical protein